MTRSNFYRSKAWRVIKKNIWLKQHCLCARCKRPVYVYGLNECTDKKNKLIGIVHHKIYLNDINVTDDSVALNEDNLEGLCIDCHNKEHFSNDVIKNNYYFDDKGNLKNKI